MSYPKMDVRLDEETRRFSVKCSLCGKTAYAGRLPLLSGGTPGSAGYTRSYMRSYQRLLKEFNYCLVCGRWVCNGCYDTDDEHGACRGCSANK